jgi:hypothetical protein
MHNISVEEICMVQLRWRAVWLVAWLMPAVLSAASGSQESALKEEEMRSFLLNANVMKSVVVKKGKTGISRLTLNDGRITHDAAFQSVDIYKKLMVYADGRTEENFRDTYKFNLAAYEVARLVGLGDLMPVTVERKWKGRDGALSWWLETRMDEQARSKQNIQPPDPEAYNRQMLKILVFSDLVYDTDRNPGNVLISEDWRLWMIDFTRAFRLETNLEDLDDLTRCDRQLLERMRALKESDLIEKTGRYLSREETGALMARRSKLVAHFDRLIARIGEQAVLY